MSGGNGNGDRSVTFPALDGPQRVSSSSSPTSSSSSSSTAPSVRRKIRLEPGHSQMDWTRLKSSGADLRGGVSAIRRYTLAEVKQHKTKDDCWMAIAGKVYNVTQYLKFHPGGVGQLMRGAGSDATQLFMKVHSWVNYEHLLGDACLVGYLVPDPDAAGAGGGAAGAASASLSPFSLSALSLRAKDEPSRMSPAQARAAAESEAARARAAAAAATAARPSAGSGTGTGTADPPPAPPLSATTSLSSDAPGNRDQLGISAAEGGAPKGSSTSTPYSSSSSTSSSSSSSPSLSPPVFAVPALPQHKQ
ncbi:hypothetical protein DFJ73DRAFT_661498 [Zopfochytrium polystomum]|nr:hypothetical protein DFJ73DRAFT_661498 [Zopfochytrium polystomum]